MIEFPEEISLPAKWAIAFITLRPDFLNLINEPMSKEETREVAKAMHVVLEKLIEQEERIKILEEHLKEAICNLKDAAASLRVTANTLERDGTNLCI